MVLTGTNRETTSSSSAWSVALYQAAQGDCSILLAASCWVLLSSLYLFETISPGPVLFILRLLVSLPAAHSLALTASLQAQA